MLPGANERSARSVSVCNASGTAEPLNCVVVQMDEAVFGCQGEVAAGGAEVCLPAMQCEDILLFNFDWRLEAHLSVEVAMQHASGTSCRAFAWKHRDLPSGSWARRQYDRMSNFLNQKAASGFNQRILFANPFFQVAAYGSRMASRCTSGLPRTGSCLRHRSAALGL